MTPRLMIAAIALATVTVPAFAQAPVATAQQTAPAAHQYRTTLHDQNGKPISRADFDAALRHGQRYVSHPDVKTGVVTLALLPPGISTPDSFAPTDLKNLTFTWITAGGHHYSVEFHDVRGRRIDQREFAAGAAQGQRYTQVLDGKTGSAILTLLPVGVNSPGSFPTSKWLVVAKTPSRAVKHAAG